MVINHLPTGMILQVILISRVITLGKPMALGHRGGTAGTFLGEAGTLKMEVDASDDVPDFNWRIC